MHYDVARYYGGQDVEVANLILSIQNGEGGLNLTVDDQPDLRDINASYADGGFWVAKFDGEIVGTIGLLRFDQRGALKKFFVAKDHRGSAGPAAALMDYLMSFARSEALKDIFLDTPSVAMRSHAFYRKVGFKVVDQSVLPPTYCFPDRDSLIFQQVL